MTIVKAAEQVVYDFSTHILTWRMTSSNAFKFSSSSFQLTSSQGGWQKIPYIIEIKSVFQLTSSQGGWRMERGNRNHPAIFSTHIVTRRMTFSSSQYSHSHPFQLTSSQGGWRIRKGWYHLHILFNSHPHKEDDQTIHRQCPQYYLFNSHPHKEDDATSGSLRLWEVYFQLTSSQGGWRGNLSYLLRYCFFNSHPHKEDDLSPVCG